MAEVVGVVITVAGVVTEVVGDDVGVVKAATLPMRKGASAVMRRIGWPLVSPLVQPQYPVEVTRTVGSWPHGDGAGPPMR